MESEKQTINKTKVIILVAIIIAIVAIIYIIKYKKTVQTSTSVAENETNYEMNGNEASNAENNNADNYEDNTINDSNDSNNNNSENYDVSNAQKGTLVYAITKINIRKEDSEKSAVIGKINAEESATLIKSQDNGWCKVKYNNKEGFIYSKYLTTEKPEEAEHNEIDTEVINPRNLDKNKPMVALTFDDGPNPVSTPIILDTLEKYNARATFFDLGSLMGNNSKIVKREEEIGCEVASHTYSHKNLNTLSKNEVLEEQEKTGEQMQKILGHTSKLIRPPYGNANFLVKSYLNNYALIGWDIDTLDWKSKNAESVIKEVRKYSNYDGRIVLMHSIYKSTAEAVKTIVPELIKKGYQLVTISEMAEAKGIKLQSGILYTEIK